MMVLFGNLLPTLLGNLTSHALQKRRDLGNFRRSDAATQRRHEDSQRFQAALGGVDALRQHLYASERDRVNAERSADAAQRLEYVKFNLARQHGREERHAADAPFSYDAETVRRYVQAAGEDGRSPVLLFAPIAGESTADEARPFRVGLRRSWQSLKWAANMRSLDGVFKRPLTGSDVDLLVFREAIPDIPVIVVYGEMQTSSRLWITLVAWGVTGGDADVRIDFNLPPLSVPQDDPAAMLEFQDDLGRVCGTVAGVLSEWHQLLTHGTPPRIHRLVEEPEQRAWVGVAAATGYQLAADLGVCEPERAAFWQSVLLAESGIESAAAENIDDATLSRIVNSGAPDAETLAGLRTMVSAFAKIGEEARAEALSRGIDAAALAALTSESSPFRTW